MEKKNAFIFLAEGFEEIEAVTPIDLLRRAGLEVKTVAVTDNRVVVGAHGVPYTADCTLKEIARQEADALVLPGGLPGAQNLHDTPELLAMIRRQLDTNRGIVGAICASPAFILGEEGMLQGKRATCYPGCEPKMKGAEVLSDLVVVDGAIITGKGPAASIPFGLALVEALLGTTAAKEVADGILY